MPIDRWCATAFPVINFDDNGPDGFSATIKPASFTAVETTREEVGQMLYTSGSTGRPKGVPLSHYGQLWAISTRTSGALNQDDRYIIAQPLFHMNGLFAIKTIFAQNASWWCCRRSRPAVILRPSPSTKVTAATAVPTCGPVSSRKRNCWRRMISPRFVA